VEEEKMEKKSKFSNGLKGALACISAKAIELKKIAECKVMFEINYADHGGNGEYLNLKVMYLGSSDGTLSSYETFRLVNVTGDDFFHQCKNTSDWCKCTQGEKEKNRL